MIAIKVDTLALDYSLPRWLVCRISAIPRFALRSLSLEQSRHFRRQRHPKLYLRGFLPDNGECVRILGQSVFMSLARNPFALLLTHVGEDCAGALQFVQR